MPALSKAYILSMKKSEKVISLYTCSLNNLRRFLSAIGLKIGRPWQMQRISFPTKIAICLSEELLMFTSHN